MAYLLVIKEEAQHDATDAYLYYEEQQEGLGERFLDALQKRYIDLSNHPEYYSYISTSQQENILRDVGLEHFPYVIIFEIEETNVIVYAIHLTHKQQKSSQEKANNFI